LLVVVYEERCPEKVGLVDGMMTTYAGEESEYYAKARRECYGWDENSCWRLWNKLMEVVASNSSA